MSSAMPTAMPAYPAALIDSAGNVTERYEYDAYGNFYVLEPNLAPDPDGKSDYENYYLFTGRRVDILDNSSLKIQYNRNRNYDYYTGRWLTHDPIGYINGLNLYEYGQCNPTLKLDPLGLACLETIRKTVEVEWNCAGCVGPSLFGKNYIMRRLEANAKPPCCKFVGAPALLRTTTSRALWSGSLISENGPTFFRNSAGCECYLYSTTYKWSQGVSKPPGWPGWLPWPFKYWMQTEITITICADMTAKGSAQNTTNKPKAWSPKTAVR